jgi:hypothetical protein
MRRISILVLGLAILGLTAQAALGTSGAHFFSATGSVDSTGALVVTWDEAGLGSDTVNYSLDVTDASATYACINGGGNHPKAANKETFNGPLPTANGTFTPKNGRVRPGGLSTGPLSAGTFSCPGGQRLVLASVSYSGITLTDTTNGVAITVADTARVFFVV